MPCLSVENEVHHFTIIFSRQKSFLDLQQLPRFVVKKIGKYEKLWCYLLMIGQYIKYWIMIGLIISQGQTKVKILWGRKKQKMRNVSILLSWKHKSQTEVIDGAQSTPHWWKQLLIYVIACIYDVIIIIIYYNL